MLFGGTRANGFACIGQRLETAPPSCPEPVIADYVGHIEPAKAGPWYLFQRSEPPVPNPTNNGERSRCAMYQVFAERP